MTEKSCSRCMFYERETGDTCGLDFGRCTAKIPFWVPGIVQDYRSWVSYSQGENCQAFIDGPSRDAIATMRRDAAKAKDG